MPLELSFEQRTELQNLVCECELHPERDIARMTELMLLRDLAALCRKSQGRLPLPVQQLLARLPRRPNAAEWERLAEPPRETLELEPQ